jgi:hypothetical protein
MNIDSMTYENYIESNLDSLHSEFLKYWGNILRSTEICITAKKRYTYHKTCCSMPSAICKEMECDDCTNRYFDFKNNKVRTEILLMDIAASKI